MHDAAYKLIYSHRRMVADLLRGFLPDSPEAGFDFGTLEPLPASHVGRGLRRREGDLMWRVRARAAPGGGWVHVLVLLEFQSRVDRHMALRAMTYTGLALEGLVRRGERSREDARSTVPLPPVIPFVVYNGKRRWTAPLDVSELFATAPRCWLGCGRRTGTCCWTWARRMSAGCRGTTRSACTSRWRRPRWRRRSRFCPGYLRRWRDRSTWGCGWRSPSG